MERLELKFGGLGGQGVIMSGLIIGKAADDYAIDLAGKTELLIYVQAAATRDFERACRKIEEADCYGTRIFVSRGTQSLLLADGVAEAYRPWFDMRVHARREGWTVLAGRKRVPAAE